MILYFSISFIVLFFAAYFTLHMTASLRYHAPFISDQAGIEERAVVLIPAYKADSDFPNRLKTMKDAAAGLPVSWYVVLQDSSSDVEHEVAQIADFLDHIPQPKIEGNPYHEVLRFAAKRLISISKTFIYTAKKVIILDLDNTIDAASLRRLLILSSQAHLVQARRQAKSITTNVSVFDGLSEQMNDSMMRASRSAFGAPIELSGSGFITDIDWFYDAVHALDGRAPGMDKNLLIQMLKRFPQARLLFDSESVVLDEKTTQSPAFARQRLRWFGNQYFNAFHYTKDLFLLALFTMRWGIFDYAISLWRPPRSVQFLFSLSILPIDIALFMTDWVSFPALALASLVFLLGAAIFAFSNLSLSQLSSGFSASVTISLRTAGLAYKSLSSKWQGTFLSTREDA